MAADRGQFDLNKTLPLPPGIQEFPEKTHSAEGGDIPATPLDLGFDDHATLQNSFSEANEWSYRPDHASHDKGVATKIAQRSPHIPQSRSDGYIDHKSTPLKERAAQYYIPPYLLSKRSATDKRNKDSFTESNIRGRPTSSRKGEVNEVPDEPRKHNLDWPLPTRKRSRSPHKRLFGENGWLSRSNSAKEASADRSAKQNNEESSRRPGFRLWGEKAKQKPEDTVHHLLTSDKSCADDVEPQYAPPTKSSTSHNDSEGTSSQVYRSTFPISIDAMTQMVIYAELELLIVTQVNRYLMEQHKKTRISADSVTKVVTHWKSKNRPQVLEFMFDQQTQRELVLYNISSLQFADKYHHNNVKLHGVLSQWKAIAKEMNVRTFCNPDSMIKEHVLVTRKICEMVNARGGAYTALGQLEELVKTLIKDAETERQERRMKLGTPKVVGIRPISPIRSPTQKFRKSVSLHKDPSEA
ncbi:MAG: hypothetical protein Q9160_008285 [Pyrenula sp. 1 TL-2023]